MSTKRITITIRKGETVRPPIRIESDEWDYAPITTIENTAPVRIAATSHGIPDGWRAAVMNAKVLTEMNAENNPPKDSELRKIARIDANTVEINDINAAGFKTHTASTGQLAFYKPLDLSGFTAARMDVKDKIGGTVIASFNTTDGTLEIDLASDALWLNLTPTESAIVAKEYVTDIEMVSATGEVTPICTADSAFVVEPETTTTE